jgi:hypothetical protein
MKFTIRDLFLATVIVALAVGWWVHSRVAEANRQAVIRHANKLRDVLATAKGKCGQLEDDVELSNSFIGKASRGEPIPDFGGLRDNYEVDWTVLDEPIPGGISN